MTAFADLGMSAASIRAGAVSDATDCIRLSNLALMEAVQTPKGSYNKAVEKVQ